MGKGILNKGGSTRSGLFMSPFWHGGGVSLILPFCRHVFAVHAYRVFVILSVLATSPDVEGSSYKTAPACLAYLSETSKTNEDGRMEKSPHHLLFISVKISAAVPFKTITRTF